LIICGVTFGTKHDVLIVQAKKAACVIVYFNSVQTVGERILEHGEHIEYRCESVVLYRVGTKLQVLVHVLKQVSWWAL